MARRGDNIHKRKDGRWEGRYRIGTNSSGKTKYASVYGKTYGEVKSKLIHSIEVSSCNNITQKKSHALKFTDILLLWIRNNNLKHKAATELKYLYLIENHIIPGLGRFPITEINSILINNFLEEKSKKGRLNGQGGLSASYIKTMAFIIKSAISFAVKEDYCQPLKSEIFIPPKYKKDLSILSKENQNLLETALIVDIDYTKLGILIALHSGIRIGEVCALTWSNIDLDNQVLHINHTVSRVKASENSNKKRL